MFLLGCALIGFMGANVDWVYGGGGLRCFGFGLGFLLLALPIPEAFYYPIVSSLQNLVAGTTVELLNVAGIPAERSGTLIQLSHSVVGVDEACSGIRSLQSTLMATLFLGHLLLRGVGFKTLLIGAGVVLALIGNVVRSCFLSYTAYAKGVNLLNAVHDTAGWSILAFTAVGVALLSWAFSRMETQNRAR
jgi:exosortase